MSKPRICYLVSSPDGDITVNDEKLNLTLEGDPTKTTYREYFKSIEKFLMKDNLSPLISAINNKTKKNVNINDIKKIIIRAEKHGAISHPASIEVFYKHSKTKFCLNVSVINSHSVLLEKEFTNIKKLNERFKFSYLPDVHLFKHIGNFSFLLEDWLEGYHEFHFTYDHNKQPYLNLWEFGNGYKRLTKEQTMKIFKEISKILTLYFDMEDFSQINLWHNSAGDFIAKINGKNIDVKLTTVREYEPFIVFKETESKNIVIALIYFLFNLLLIARLDKIDGIKETIWVDEFCIDPLIQGFVEALRIKKKESTYYDLDIRIIKTLKTFRKDELKIAHKPILELHKKESDYKVIFNNIDEHIKNLYFSLQNYPL